jgi:hypothetical protein
MRHPLVWIAAVLLLCGLGAAQAVMPIPSATGYLTDQTGIVEPGEMARIQVMLGKYEVGTGRRLSVLLVQSTPDEELEQFADRVLADWGLDQREQGGALLLWSAEGYVLIRPSAALAERLDGEAQNQILSRWVVPAFARGEAGVGIRQGLEQMIAVLDGKSVAEPPPVPEALELGAGDEEAEDEDRATPAVASTEAPVSSDGLPAWIGRLPEDLRRLTAPFSDNLDAGVMGWLREAGREAEQLPVLASGLSLQMRGEQVEPPFPGLSEFAVYAWAVSLGLTLLVLLPRGAFVPALFIGAVDSGFFLWLATGFVALGGLLVLAGVLAPLLVPLLRAILRGSDDSEREDETPIAWPMPQRPVRTPARSAAVPRAARSVAARPARGRTKVNPMSVQAGPGRQRIDVLLDRLGRIAYAEIRRLRLVHVGVLVAVCIISLPLAILVVLGTIAVAAYRSGAAYLLVDVLVKERNVREQLKRQLPRPSADVMPGT